MNEVSGFWKDRRVFVTGSRGFLGSWAVKDLKERGAVVVGLVRDIYRGPSLTGDPAAEPQFLVFGRLEDYDVLERAINEYEIDTVLHLGAQPIVGTAYRNPRSTFEANIRGTWNILEACRQISTVKRIVIASSDKAYGTADRLPYEETNPLRGQHPYDVSKSCADLIAQTYHTTYGLPVCVTRCANFYGGGDLNFNRIVPGTIQSVYKGEAPILRSDGTMVRDYIYVRDVVAAYLQLAELMSDPAVWGRAYNFSVELPLSVLEITNKIVTLMGRPDLEPIILNQAKAEIQAQYMSAALARRELGWVPRYSLDQSLLETVDWYRNYFRAAEAGGAA
jgi:CDP-glucose 4,6-dehydratase